MLNGWMQKMPGTSASSLNIPLQGPTKVRVMALDLGCLSYLQEVARALRTAGPTQGMPETLRLRSLPLSVRAAIPTSVTLVHRLSDTSCVQQHESGDADSIRAVHHECPHFSAQLLCLKARNSTTDPVSSTRHYMQVCSWETSSV